METSALYGNISFILAFKLLKLYFHKKKKICELWCTTISISLTLEHSLEPSVKAEMWSLAGNVVHDLKQCYKDPLSVFFSLIRKIAAYDEEIQRLYEEMEQQIKKEKEQFLLKVSVSVMVSMESAPPFSGFKLVLGVKLKPTKYVSQQRNKNTFYLTAAFVLQLQTFHFCSFKVSDLLDEGAMMSCAQWMA